MSRETRLEVRGLREAQKRTEEAIRDLQGAPMLNAMRDALMVVERDAKRNAPVDTGRLRASITPEVRRDGREIIGVVGSNVVYAPFVELGTRPHFPPLYALETWAKRRGISAFLVARAIAIRGTRAVRFLQRAMESNAQYIYRRLQEGIGHIIGG